MTPVIVITGDRIKNIVKKMIFLILISIQSLSIAAEATSVEFEFRGRYIFEQLEADEFNLEQYRVTVKESGNTYRIRVNDTSRRGVFNYFSQALQSIPLIHDYELIYQTPVTLGQIGFVFKTDKGFQVEYMKDLEAYRGIYLSTEIESQDYLTVIHEALDILNLFTPK